MRGLKLPHKFCWQSKKEDSGVQIDSQAMLETNQKLQRCCVRDGLGRAKWFLQELIKEVGYVYSNLVFTREEPMCYVPGYTRRLIRNAVQSTTQSGGNTVNRSQLIYLSGTDLRSSVPTDFV